MLYEKKVKYLDYYEGGMRVRGGGFAKLEVRDGTLRMELLVTGLHHTDTFARDVVLCGTGREEAAGKIEIAAGRGKFGHLWRNLENIGGTGIGYEELSGIRVPLGGGREISGKWQGRPQEKREIRRQEEREAGQQERKESSGQKREAVGLEKDGLSQTADDAEKAIFSEDMGGGSVTGGIAETGRDEAAFSGDVIGNGRAAEDSLAEEANHEKFVENAAVRKSRAIGEAIEEDTVPADVERTKADLRRAEKSPMKNSARDGTQRRNGTELQGSSLEDTAGRNTAYSMGNAAGSIGNTAYSMGNAAGRIGNTAYGTRNAAGRMERGWEKSEGMAEGMRRTKRNGYREPTLSGRQETDKKRADDKLGGISEDWKSRSAGREAREIVDRVNNSGKRAAEREDRERRQSANSAESRKKPVKLMEDKWSQLWAIYPHIRPFQDAREYISLGPSDFVLFPEASYKSVNNSFLLHGYYNYQHLLLARVEQKGEYAYYIGVPGNFYEKEKQVAIMFGFESFECAEEPAQPGDFGYYMMRTEI